MAIRGLGWGQVFWKVSAHEKNESAQQRPLHTCTHTHTHTLTVSPSLLFFCSLLSLSTPPSAVWFSLVNQNTFASDTVSSCILSPCPPPPHGARHSFFHLFSLSSLSLSLPPSKAHLFLDALSDLSALPFLFKQAHEPSFTLLVTSLLMCRSSTCLHNDTVSAAYVCFPSPSLSPRLSLPADLRWICW